MRKFSEVLVRDDFGMRFRELREDHDYSMEQLERLTGINKSTIYRWEHQQCRPVSLQPLQMMVEVFDIPVSYFLQSENESNPQVLISKEWMQQLTIRLNELERRIKMGAPEFNKFPLSR